MTAEHEQLADPDGDRASPVVAVGMTSSVVVDVWPAVARL